MAEHEVTVKIPRVHLDRADCTFEIRQNGSKIGRLQVSRGRLDWFPGAASKKAHQISWTKFISWAEGLKKRPTKKRK